MRPAFALVLVPLLLPRPATGGAQGASRPEVVRPAELPCGPGQEEVPTFLQLARLGDSVARIEVVVPREDPFLLRATVPVPRGTLRREATRLPLALKGADGVLEPTQLDVVAHHARETDGASVVEVVGLVHRPAGASVGARAVWELARVDQQKGAFVAPPAVEALVATPGAVRLRAQDAIGRRLEADLLADLRLAGPSLETIAAGPLRRVDRLHCVAESAVPDGSAHSFGVQCFATRFAHANALRLDFQVHDAFAGEDPANPDDDVLGDLVFEQLDLVLPAGWIAVATHADPFLGAAFDSAGEHVQPVVLALPAGKLHVLPQLSRFQRRFVLAPASERALAESIAAEDGLGFVAQGATSSGFEGFSWWNATTPHYWPQHVPLPRWDGSVVASLRSSLANEHAALAALVAAGLPSPTGYPIASGVLGWAHPWGSTYGGMSGGDEVWLWDGVDVAAAGAVAGVRAAQLRLRMYACRQPNVMYEARGRPSAVEDWVEAGPSGAYFPVWWFNGPLLAKADPWGLLSADQSQYELATAQGRVAPYDAALRAYMPIDYQHLVRHVRSAKTLVWLANDPLARLELESQAESWRFSFPELPQTSWGEAIETGFLHERRHVDARPAQGMGIGRGEGWGLDALVAWHAIATPRLRERYLPFFERFSRLVAEGQSSCDGSLMAWPSLSCFGGNYRVRTQTETAIVEHALLGMRMQALRGASPCEAQRVEAVLRRSFGSTIVAPAWSESLGGPLVKVAVGPYHEAVAGWCGWIPPDGASPDVDTYQSDSSFAHGWRATGDASFLAKVARLHGWSDWRAVLQQPLQNWHNTLALQRLAQDHPGP
ncbi:MAG: hypothetical protein RL112_1948 [Planctomycetota bacterium]